MCIRDRKAAASATTTDTSYSDDNIQVSLTEKTVENTQVYIADITVSSSDYLKTAFAQNTYGTNVTAKTSVTAANNSAILAVNGDYYGANSCLLYTSHRHLGRRRSGSLPLSWYLHHVRRQSRYCLNRASS